MEQLEDSLPKEARILSQTEAEAEFFRSAWNWITGNKAKKAREAKERARKLAALAKKKNDEASKKKAEEARKKAEA